MRLEKSPRLDTQSFIGSSLLDVKRFKAGKVFTGPGLDRGIAVREQSKETWTIQKNFEEITTRSILIGQSSKLGFVEKADHRRVGNRQITLMHEFWRVEKGGITRNTPNLETSKSGFAEKGGLRRLPKRDITRKTSF